jgi:type 1 fimbria pilin
MKHSIKCISTLLVLGAPIASHAACDTYMNSDHGLSLPATITVPDSLEVGGIILRQAFNRVVADGFIHCPTATIISLFGRYSLPDDPLTHAYPTEAPGVGMKIRIRDSRSITNDYAIRSGEDVLPRGTHPIFTNAEAIFYKIGAVTDGVVPSGTLFDYKMHNGGGVYPGRFILRLNNSVRFVRPAATCDLAAGDVNRTITLPEVRVSAFDSTTSTGERDFELTANCSDASNATFRFTGTPAPGNPVLFANTGSAGGVALGLYSRIDGLPQLISANDTRTVPVSGNRAVLPLTAAYHKNGTVSHGTLASTATVTLTYN